MREARNGEDAADAEGGWLDWLRACGVPAITGVDTRTLVRHIRDRGAMRGGIFGAGHARGRGARADRGRALDGRRRLRPHRDAGRAGGARRRRAARRRAGHRDQALNHSAVPRRGIAGSPCSRATSRPRRCSTAIPDLVFLANGPGDPAALDYVVDTVREVVGKKPVVGICLGHQLLCRAVGLDTFKLPFGHRGANHPVKDLESRQDRHHLAEPRLRRPPARRRRDDRGRRAGALGDRFRRRRAHPPEPLRPHGRGPGAARGARVHGPVPPRGRARARTTRATCSTASWSWRSVIWPPPRREPLEGSIVRMRAAVGPSTARACARRPPTREIWTWMDRAIPGEAGAFDRWFDTRLAVSEHGDEWCFATISVASGRPIGSSSYLAVRPEHDGLEIGWTWLNPVGLAHRRQPRGEAADARPRLRRARLHAGRVQDRLAQRALARAALEALGASFEGIFRNHMLMPVTGVRDSAYYSITDEDWPDGRGRPRATRRATSDRRLTCPAATTSTRSC